MSKKTFQYFLGPDSNSFYSVAGGNVVSSTTAAPLISDLVDWADTEMLFKRSNTFAGVFREMIVPATFTRDGAKILRFVRYTQGTEAKCLFTTKRLNPTTQLYEPFAVQSVDFTTFVDDEHSVTVNLKDDGLGNLLKAKENTVYEIPIGSDALSMYLDGVTLQGNAHYVIPEQGTSSPYTLSNTMLIAPAGAEGLNEAIQTNTFQQLQPSILTLAKGKIYEAKYVEDVTVIFDNLQLYALWPSSANNPATLTVIVRRGLPDGSAVQDYVLWQALSALSPGQSQVYQVPKSTLQFQLLSGYAVGVFLVMLQGSSFASSTDSRFQVIPKDGNTATIDITSQYRRPATLAKGYRLLDLLQKAANKLPGGPYTVQSGYLTAPNLYHHGMCPRNVVLTSGDAIRGLGTPTAPAKMKVTWSDLNKDAKARCFAGIGIEGNTLIYERMAHFFRNDIITIDLDEEVTDFQASVATDWLWNTLDIGYPKETSDNLNGKSDPFLTAQYATPAVFSNENADYVSPYCASYIVHETLRANLAGKKTTDSDADNSIHLLEISNEFMSFDRPAPFGPFVTSSYKLARRQNDAGGSVSGVLAGATAYNLGLSYARNLRRIGPAVRTNMNGVQSSANLAFQTAEQNSELISKLGQDPQIVEKGDVSAATLDAPLFQPTEFKFNHPVPRNLQELVAAAPYGKVRFKRRGRLLSGFILEIGIKPATNDARAWRLLAAPDTDPMDLVH